MSILASNFHMTSVNIEETMTLAQIGLHYRFYLREQQRNAKVLANVVAASIFGGQS